MYGLWNALHLSLWEKYNGNYYTRFESESKIPIIRYIETDGVEKNDIYKRHNEPIILFKKYTFKKRIFILKEEIITTEQLLNVLSQMPDDFYEEERTDDPPQQREEL